MTISISWVKTLAAIRAPCRNVVLFAVCLVWATAPPVIAQTDTNEAVSAEDKDYYAKNKDLIARLETTARDASKLASERNDALLRLSIYFPTLASDIAIELASAADDAVAENAAAQLASRVVMMDLSDETGAHAEHIKGLEPVISKLRELVTDQRPGVRARVATVMASIADEPSLKRISEAVATGRLEDAEAVRYFTLGDAARTAPYVEPYLLKGSGAARAQAVAHLGAFEKYQPGVRDNVLTNSAAPEAARVAAAGILSKKDPKYLDYAVALTTDPASSLSIAVQERLLSGVLDRGKGQLNTQQINQLRTTIQSLQPQLPDAARAPLMERFNKTFQDR